MDVLINIDVDDLERGIAFYVGAFGLQVSRRFGEAGVELTGVSSKIYLLRKLADRDYRRHWTPVHLDFVVDDDLPGAVARAEAAGAVVESPIKTHAWGSIAILADPFGHGVCL